MEVLYRLSYRGIFLLWGREDSNLRRRSRQIYSLLPLAARAHPRSTLTERPDMVANAPDISTEGNGPRARPQPEPGKGFEPPTGRLQGGCSTSELPGRAAAGGALHAGFATPACQHAPACGLRLSARSGLRPPLSARFGPAALAFSQERLEAILPARSRDCNSANPTPTSLPFPG